MACRCYCNVHSGLGFGYDDEELTKSLQQIGVSERKEFLQKTALLGTTRIL